MPTGASDPRRKRTVTLVLALTLTSPGLRAADEPELVQLLSQGPWSAVSGLIGYRGRLWYVNGEKFVNHNAADLYSYDPARGESRYERQLFSQDAGDPSVVDGLLVWPFEDARFSAGRGEFAITDGRAWRWSWLPHQQVFHAHAAATSGSELYVATSAWRAGIQRSRDLGRSWELLYVHPTPSGRVSRFTTLAVLDGTPYAGLTSRSQPGPKLFRLQRGAAEPVAGWPDGTATRHATTHGGWVYAVNAGPEGTAVLRARDGQVERVDALDGYDVRGFASGERLWAVAADRDGGLLLASRDGVRWSRAGRMPGAEPVAVALYAGRVYAGAIGPGEHGSLWGPPVPAPVAPAVDAATLPELRPASEAGDLAAELRALDAVLSGTGELERYHQRLEAALTPVLSRRSPAAGRALAERLALTYPDAEISRFGGRVRIALARSNRWHLLRAIALTGHGRVPLELLAEPWASERNGAEKYLDPMPAAAWTVAWTGQDDPQTIAALVDRLGNEDLPIWANGDLVGALSALTGERFGYDLDAWRRGGRQREAVARARRHAADP